MKPTFIRRISPRTRLCTAVLVRHTTDPALPDPFFLIVADHDHGVFAVERPITDRAPWNRLRARWPGDISGASNADRQVRTREALAVDYRQSRGFRGVAPGSIVRPRG